MIILKNLSWVILSLFILIFGLSFLAVLLVVSLIEKLKKPMHMQTIDEQIEAINHEVAMELCWAESYEECDQIIEKGKQRIKDLVSISQVQKSTSVTGNIDPFAKPLFLN